MPDRSPGQSTRATHGTTLKDAHGAQHLSVSACDGSGNTSGPPRSRGMGRRHRVRCMAVGATVALESRAGKP